MKKILGLILLFGIAVNAMSQIDVKSKYINLPNLSGLNNIYIFEKIDNSTEIHFTAANALQVVKWYTFLNGVKTEITNISTLSPTETYIDPLDKTGYIIEVDGQKVSSCWVFDYSKYSATIQSVTATDGVSLCSETNVTIQAQVPSLEYQNVLGSNFKLNRAFNINYTTLEWSDSNWKEIKKDTTVFLPRTTDVVIPSPLTHTTFLVTGDEFATQLGLEVASGTSNMYTTKAVKCKITSITSTVRKEFTNENNRPVAETQLEGSAPLDVNFYSNPTPAVNTYSWKIFKDNSNTPFITRADKDNSYTFTQYGHYKVEVTVSNQYCSYADTISVDASESKLMVPRIFTPNGDGIQDEFKVAYQSIIQFNAVVLNRWGRRLFTWTDPAKGWDGTIKGKEVSNGAYYYIINAVGSEGKKYKLKGCINLLRD